MESRARARKRNETREEKFLEGGLSLPWYWNFFAWREMGQRNGENGVGDGD